MIILEKWYEGIRARLGLKARRRDFVKRQEVDEQSRFILREWGCSANMRYIGKIRGIK